ncbi:DUF726 domain-containing protein [Sagittula sp. SSi028]|uniref:DUF726 domain-containing protein n=1 Tax=Sagittula sp. SSi028 TaxID=3400636 RepID=UPI003AF725BE
MWTDAMPMLNITAHEDHCHLHAAGGPLLPELKAALDRDPGPVTVMVHGFRYQPGLTDHCPHQTLFATGPATATIPAWPRHLGLRGQAGEGLGLSFGWFARGTIWQAHRRAETAGHALARLLADVKALDPQRPVHAIGHSLGARVILSAIRAGQPGVIDRTVLLAGAEFAGTARHVLHSSAGRRTEVLNVASRENDLFDFMLERLVPAEAPGDRMLGAARTTGMAPNMVTLQLDDARSLSALRAAGFPISPTQQRICHWSPYMRAGVFPLYRAYLSGTLPLARLRGILPDATTARWSRLLSRPFWATPDINAAGALTKQS